MFMVELNDPANLFYLTRLASFSLIEAKREPPVDELALLLAVRPVEVARFAAETRLAIVLAFADETTGTGSPLQALESSFTIASSADVVAAAKTSMSRRHWSISTLGSFDSESAWLFINNPP